MTTTQPPTPTRAEVDRVARVLMAAWEGAEGRPVTASYVATFADMARAILASDVLAQHTEAAEARGVDRGIRLAADLVRGHVLGDMGDRTARFLVARADRAALPKSQPPGG